MECPSCKATIPENAKFCNECGIRMLGPQPVLSKALEENRPVTVVFTDISGYTAMSERLDAEEVKGLTRQIFSEINRVASRHGGQVDKLIGDCAMLLFGVPAVHEDDAARAVRTALEIHKYVDGLNSAELQRKIGRGLGMHTGINSGSVLAGELDLARGEEKVLGDTVNTASRLCGVARPGEIVIGDMTYRLLKGGFDCAALPPQTVKGKQDALAAYRIIGKKGAADLPEGIRGPRSVLVGRDGDMAMLYRALEDLDAGQGSLVRIVAEAGGGKSRLVEEFRRGLDLSRHAWHEGHAYTFSETVSYGLWNDFFGRMWRIGEHDSPADLLKKIHDGLESEGLDPDVSMPFLALIFAIPTPETAHLDPGFAKTRIYETVLNLISCMAARTGTILHFEDLHWADPSSLDLLAHVISRLDRAVLIICAHRPAADILSEPAIGGNPAMRPLLIELSHLTVVQRDDMLRSLLGGSQAPRGLMDFLDSKNIANPFFIEETVNNLIESGLLVRANGGYSLTGTLLDAGVPSTIQEIIFARIDRLEPEAKSVLQTASVIGRSFFLNILRCVSRPEGNLESCLERLEQIDIIREKERQADLEYMFKHALLQETIYNSLLKKDRREIHGRVAEIMESAFAERLPEFYETLAHHFVRAEIRDKAIRYLLLAGKKCLDQYATIEADGHFRQAYELCVAAGLETEESRCQLLTILIEWGFVFYCFGHFRSQVELMERHLKEAESCRDLSLQSMYFAWLGLAMTVSFRFAEAYTLMRRAMALGEKSGDAKIMAYANAWAANVCAEMGLFAEGQRYGSTARELAKGFPDDHYLLSKTNFCTGQCYLRCGLVEKAAQMARESISLGHSQNKTRALVLGYSLMGDVCHARGDFKSAVEHYRKASGYAPDVFYRIWPLGFLALSLICDDRIAEAEETLALYEASTPPGEMPGFGIASRAIGGLLASKKGAYGKAFKQAVESVREYERNGSEYLHLVSCLEIAKVYADMAMGAIRPPLSVILLNLPFLLRNLPVAYPRAVRWLEETISGTNRLAMAGLEGQAWLVLGQLEKHRKRKHQAKRSFENALTAFEKTELTDYRRTAERAVAELGP